MCTFKPTHCHLFPSSFYLSCVIYNTATTVEHYCFGHPVFPKCTCHLSVNVPPQVCLGPLPPPEQVQFSRLTLRVYHHCLFFIPFLFLSVLHRGQIILYLTLSLWLASLSMIPPSSTLGAVGCRTVSSLRAAQWSMCMWTRFSVHSFVLTLFSVIDSCA